MKVSFLDFWGGFPKNDNFFVSCLKNITNDIKVVEPKKADLIFFSVFGNSNEKLKYKFKKKIFYTGEPYPTDSIKSDLRITFDLDDKNGTNFRLPNWYMYFDWFDENKYKDKNQWRFPLDYISSENEFFNRTKTKFCSFVFSKPNESREKYIKLFSNYKKIDLYGNRYDSNSLNKALPNGQYFKFDTISNYKFDLALENTIKDGYHTEKLLESRLAGCLPLYYGAKTVDEDFNKQGFIDILQYKDDELLDLLQEIDNNEQKYLEYKKQPIFSKEVKIDNFLEFLYVNIK